MLNQQHFLDLKIYVGTLYFFISFFSIFRFTAVRAMWLLSPFHPIRRIAIRVLAHPIFSLIVILTILANCYVMILPDSEYTNATEIVFTAIYTYESAVKVRKMVKCLSD